MLNDPKDEFVLELAASGGAEAIVTYNRRRFVEARRLGVAVLRAKRFTREEFDRALRMEMDRIPVDGPATWGGFFVGFGLDISAYMAFSALLAWGLGSLSVRPAAGFGLIAWSFVALQLLTLALSLVYFGATPAVFSAVAALLLGWAALSSGRPANKA